MLQRDHDEDFLSMVADATEGSLKPSDAKTKLFENEEYNKEILSHECTYSMRVCVPYCITFHP